METYSSELLVLVIISFVVAFILSFGIGANDVANSFGTSVGARVLSLRTACILATVFEIAGALLIGHKVSDTLRKFLVDVNMYENSEKELILGYLSSLTGSGIWLLVATFFHLPISGTHSIVGAMIGFSIVARGTKGLQWSTLFGIVSSWFISPVFSGIVSVIVYVFIRKYILNSENQVRNGLGALPIFYGVTIAINVFSVIEGESKVLHLSQLPLYTCLIISIFVGCFGAIIVYLFVVPKHHIKLGCIPSITRANTAESAFHENRIQPNRSVNNSPMKRSDDEFYILRKYDKPSDGKIEMAEIKVQDLETRVNGANTDNENEASKKLHNNLKNNRRSAEKNDKNNTSVIPLIEIQASGMENPPNGTGSEAVILNVGSGLDSNTQKTSIETIFTFLQILTAIFGSFAHGGNDVSNAIGPLVAIWLIYSDGSVLQTSETPFFILLFGGVGIAIGLCVWGRNVIKTVGEDLTRITPSTGFSIEIGSSMTVLLASKLGLPISTTHCKVGSVVFVGWSSSTAEGVDWGLFKNIIFAWVITLPVSAVLSAAPMFLLSRYLL